MKKLSLILVILFNIVSFALLTAFLYPEVLTSLFYYWDIQGVPSVGGYLLILFFVSTFSSVLAFNREINSRFSFRFAGLLAFIVFLILLILVRYFNKSICPEETILFGCAIVLTNIFGISLLFVFSQIAVGFLVGLSERKERYNKFAKGILIFGIILFFIMSGYSSTTCGFSDVDRFNCYRKIAENTIRDDICENIPKTSFVGALNRDSCFREVGILKKDPTICRSVSGREDKFVCYRTIAELKNDIKICDNLGDEDSRDSCYYVFLKDTNRFSISNCDLIQSQDLKEQCYTKVAERTGQISICENMTIHKDSCYENIAFFHRDIAICNLIQNQILKDECIKILKERIQRIGAP